MVSSLFEFTLPPGESASQGRRGRAQPSPACYRVRPSRCAGGWICRSQHAICRMLINVVTRFVSWRIQRD